MNWVEVDFKKLGWFSNPKRKFFVNRDGLVSTLDKNGHYKNCGCYSCNKSRIRVKGTDIQIKFIVASTFFSQYIHGKYNVNFIDNDVSNCAFKNLFITLKTSKTVKNISNKTLQMFNDYLEKGSLNKMAGWILNKKDFFPDIMYSDEDAKQELISFCFYKLYQYDEKKEKYRDFEQFIYFKMFDAFCLVVQKKDKYAKHITFSIDSIIDSFEKGYGHTKYLIDVESIY